MTPEQLDEIERMAEAATPGPWDADVGVDFDDGCPIIAWYACGPSHESREFDEDGLPSLGAAKGLSEVDAAFIKAMREHALPLVKALREAWEALDQVSSDDRMSEAQITAAITEALKERDEARALLAALKAEHQPTDEMRSELLNEIEAHAETKAEVERLRGIVEVNDRRLAAVWDEARTEVERLKGKLMEEARWVYDTGQRAKDALAEVERLREAMRQVHALVGTVRATAVLDDIEKLREIHKITKGMVE